MKSDNIERPFVSVVMPTYNQAQFIGYAIESVLQQSYDNFELIVINNYSEDDTEKIVMSYKDKRIKYLKFNNNGVIAASRNYGIEQAQGKYIAFLDSDDIWLPEKLERQVEIMESNKNLGFVYTDAYIINEKGEKTGRGFSQAKPYRGKIFSKLFEYSAITTSTVLVRNECFRKLNLLFDPGLSPAEDYDVWLRISYFYEVDYIGQPLAEYRVNPKGNSKNLEAASKAVIAVHKKNTQSYLALNGNSLLSLKKCFALQYYRNGVCYLERGDFIKARDYLKKSISYYPLLARPHILFLFSFLGVKIYRKLIYTYRRLKYKDAF